MTWRKWAAVFKIWILDGFAYRANGIIWILGDTLPAMIMPLVFIAAMPEGGSIAGFNKSQFVLYYLTMVFITNFVTSHLMWELAWEIKQGIFTPYLLRPMSYFQFTLIRNFAWRILRISYAIPIMGLLLLFYKQYLPEMHPYLGWEVYVAVVLGHIVSFSFVYLMSMLAFYFTETHSIFGLYYIPMMFLSGQLFPISLLPDWASSAAKLLPFYYTTALPVDIITQRLSPADSLPLIGVQFLWAFVQLFLAGTLFKIGLKHYTAVGM